MSKTTNAVILVGSIEGEVELRVERTAHYARARVRVQNQSIPVVASGYTASLLSCHDPGQPIRLLGHVHVRAALDGGGHSLRIVVDLILTNERELVSRS